MSSSLVAMCYYYSWTFVINGCDKTRLRSVTVQPQHWLYQTSALKIGLHGQECFDVCLFFKNCCTVSNMNLHNKSLIHTEGFNKRKPLICLPALKTFSAVEALPSKHLSEDLDYKTFEISSTNSRNVHTQSFLHFIEHVFLPSIETLCFQSKMNL